MPADNKNFSLTELEKNILIEKFPNAKKSIKNLIGGEEFLHNKKRFCLWLVDANPSEIKNIADRPHEFRDLKNPKNFICSDANLMIPDAEIFHFGILTSSVHMAWTKNVCGYLGTSFRYSKEIVYNNFPFPEKDFEKISATAQNILQVRKNYPSASLADLYDPILMPKDLRDAHKKNDLAVFEAYGFDKNFSESDIVAELFKLYHSLI